MTSKKSKKRRSPYSIRTTYRSYRLAIGWQKQIDPQSKQSWSHKEKSEANKRHRAIRQRRVGNWSIKVVDGAPSNCHSPSILAEKLASVANSRTPNSSSLLQSTLNEGTAVSTLDMVQRDERSDNESLEIKSHFRCDFSEEETSTFHGTGVALSDRNNAECFTECMLLGHRGSVVGK